MLRMMQTVIGPRTKAHQDEQTYAQGPGGDCPDSQILKFTIGLARYNFRCKACCGHFAERLIFFAIFPVWKPSLRYESTGLRFVRDFGLSIYWD